MDLHGSVAVLFLRKQENGNDSLFAAKMFFCILPLKWKLGLMALMLINSALSQGRIQDIKKGGGVGSSGGFALMIFSAYLGQFRACKHKHNCNRF